MVREVLTHILCELSFLDRHLAGLTWEEFAEDELLQRAFIRSLEVIGEASKRLPANFKQQHPTIEWRSMAGMRDRLIHGYFGVDLELVWDVVNQKCPALRRQIEPLIAVQSDGLEPKA